MYRNSITAAIFVSSALFVAGTAQAHWDRPSCYIEVHDGCYVDTTSPCSDADYKDFLANCDATYPSLGGRPGGLTTPSGPLSRRN